MGVFLLQHFVLVRNAFDPLVLNRFPYLGLFDCLFVVSAVLNLIASLLVFEASFK